jgi:hypothetical protein
VPDSLLQILKVLLLAIVGLFFLRVLRAVWVETKWPPPETKPPQAPPSGSRTNRTQWQLKVVDPPPAKGTRSRSYDLGDEMTVGRAAGCGVALDDSTVSQLHARIFRQDGRLWIEDLGSTNGTFVNRRKISAPIALRRGDKVQVGVTVLEVVR